VNPIPAPGLHVGTPVIFRENVEHPCVAGVVTRLWPGGRNVTILTSEDTGRTFVRRIDCIDWAHSCAGAACSCPAARTAPDEAPAAFAEVGVTPAERADLLDTFDTFAASCGDLRQLPGGATVICTRSAYHDGDHLAGIGLGNAVARWRTTAAAAVPDPVAVVRGYVMDLIAGAEALRDLHSPLNVEWTVHQCEMNVLQAVTAFIDEGAARGEGLSPAAQDALDQLRERLSGG
jgi:hypothetical protein